MVQLGIVQPANVFGSAMQGQQARQASDMNAMRMQGAEQQQQMQAIAALASVYKGARTAEEFENGKSALRKMGLLGEAEDFSVDEGIAVLRGFLPQEQMTEFERLAQGLSGGEVDRARRIKLGLEPRAAQPTQPRIIKGGDGRSYYEGTGEPVLPNDPGKNPTFRPATPEELAQYGASAGQIDTGTGRFYPGKGEGIEFTSPDGTTVRIGGSGRGSGLGTAGSNALDLKEIDARTSLARLDGIRERIASNPVLLEGQTLLGNARRMGMEWADYIGGEGALSPEQQRDLVDMTQLRGDVLENLNFTIKEITGAAMTEAEAKRIGGTLPNINDSPTVFMAKLDRSLKRTRAAVARLNYWRNGGFGDAKDPMSATTLGDMEALIDRRASELARQVSAGEMGADEASAAFAQEFGI